MLVRSVNALRGCTQTQWQEREHIRKPSATGTCISFKAVPILRAAQALEQQKICSSRSPSSHPTLLAQTAEQDPVTNIWDKHAEQYNALPASHSLHSFLREQLHCRLNTSAQHFIETQNSLKVLIFFMKNMQQGHWFQCQIVLYVNSLDVPFTELIARYKWKKKYVLLL